MNRIKKWIFPGLFFLMSGCVSYSTIELDVLKPAEVIVPVEIASVVVVDNAFPFQPGDSGVHKIKLPTREYAIDSILVDDFGRRIIQSFGESLNAKSFFDSVYVVKQPFNTLEGGKPLALLSPAVVDSLCDFYNAQAVIELGHFEYGSLINVMDFGDQYFATLDARVSAYWKIHNKIADDVFDVHLQRDTIFWESTGPTILGSVEKLPLIRDALNEAAAYSGQQYSEYISPTWEKTRRYFFKKGHPLFYDASVQATRGDWDEAGRIWFHIYELGTEKQKARAAYNLALTQEVKGDFIEATSWAYRSMEHFQEVGNLSLADYELEMAKSYYIELAQRLQEKKKLDKQFGVYD
ncbi:DUF6340 family protein [Marinilabilia sp.]|uniref:DUF6340 family protein n=1 Tax=Marinilabilia sp. TaxID=2021252 RepID=UPI0025B9CE86|nr:DUF6340 family protein [Marinilabilia sp.]